MVFLFPLPAPAEAKVSVGFECLLFRARVLGASCNIRTHNKLQYHGKIADACLWLSRGYWDMCEIAESVLKESPVIPGLQMLM